MGDVLGQNSLEVSTPEDEHPIEAITADGPDEALGECVGPGSPDRGADDADTFCLEDLVEARGDLGVRSRIKNLTGWTRSSSAMVRFLAYWTAQVGSLRIGAGSMSFRCNMAQTLDGDRTTGRHPSWPARPGSGGSPRWGSPGPVGG